MAFVQKSDVVMAFHVCKSCGINKPIESFIGESLYGDFTGVCIDCQKIQSTPHEPIDIEQMMKDYLKGDKRERTNKNNGAFELPPVLEDMEREFKRYSKKYIYYRLSL